VLLALTVASVPAAGCTSDAEPRAVERPVEHGYVGRRGAPRVAIAGDSITALARAEIVSTLRHHYRVRVDAFSGRTIAGVGPAIARQAATRPDVVVVNIGTNDMDHGPTRWRADLDRVLATVASVPCVEAFTVYDGRRRPARAQIGREINARLAELAASGSIHLIDWNAAVHRDPHLVVADRIHPGGAGQRWIATSIRAAIRADC
jgi:hypothetical protein